MNIVKQLSKIILLFFVFISISHQSMITAMNPERTGTLQVKLSSEKGVPSKALGFLGLATMGLSTCTGYVVTTPEKKLASIAALAFGAGICLNGIADYYNPVDTIHASTDKGEQSSIASTPLASAAEKALPLQPSKTPRTNITCVLKTDINQPHSILNSTSIFKNIYNSLVNEEFYNARKKRAHIGLGTSFIVGLASYFSMKNGLINWDIIPFVTCGSFALANMLYAMHNKIDVTKSKPENAKEIREALKKCDYKDAFEYAAGKDLFQQSI